MTETLRNQTIGLDLVSLVLVAPLALLAAALVFRGHLAGLALAPAIGAYTSYMFLQYILGPGYTSLPGNNERLFPICLFLFTAGWMVALGAWRATPTGELHGAGRRQRGIGLVLAVLGFVTFVRYVPALADWMSASPEDDVYLAGPGFAWTIATLDLGVFLPATVAACIGLCRSSPCRSTAVEQGMVIRGEDASNPILLWVHGGPGMPDYPLTQQYPPGVEGLFTVAWWDQRGAALSYHPDIAPETMTIEQFIDDTLAVTDYLRRRFHQDRIYILGHSWGSFIAVQAAARSPERYKAYLGMAQVVHQLESEKIAYDYMLAAYRQRGDTEMVRKLEAAPVTMTGGTPDAYLKVRDAAMHKLGVGTTHEMKSVITGIFLESWRFRGYTLREKVNLWRGRRSRRASASGTS